MFDEFLDKIRVISEHYPKKTQWEKAEEELDELLEELDHAENPMGDADRVLLPDNTWSEIADVFIMCTQLIMQHRKEDVFLEVLQYKVERQLARIEAEKIRGSRSCFNCSHEYSCDWKAAGENPACEDWKREWSPEEEVTNGEQ